MCIIFQVTLEWSLAKDLSDCSCVYNEFLDFFGSIIELLSLWGTLQKIRERNEKKRTVCVSEELYST
jgi:hypothetical protein